LEARREGNGKLEAQNGTVLRRGPRRISINLVDEGLSFVATRPCEFTLRWAGIIAFGAWVRVMIPDEE
jgi:hypothetical protein